MLMLSAVGVFQQIFCKFNTLNLYKLSDRNEIFYKLKQINKTSDVFIQKIYRSVMHELYTQQNC